VAGQKVSRSIFTVSVLPHLTQSYCEYGVFASAIRKNIAAIEAINLRDFGLDKHGTVDGAPYGGGDGMVLRPEPLKAALDAVIEKCKTKPLVIAPSPTGTLWTHHHAKKLASEQRPIVFICGRFGGIDERFLDSYVDAQYSIGDVVVSGGELPALMMIDSILRFAPGVLGHTESAECDSFGESLEGCLEFPQYTRPESFEGQVVPPVLLSGDHQKIAAWRRDQSLERTRSLRPDLLD
jgi:tRNA (guanine37-N1)-methyltransferase